MTDRANGLILPKRAVSLRRENDEFVVSSWPHDVVIFKNSDAEALRKACHFLRWQIVSDTSTTSNEVHGRSLGD
jgi:acetylornithine/succinyldiaminopimelate/putrescine aminotransferase